MALVEIASTPPALVEITGTDGQTVTVPVPAAVQVSVELPGIQGPAGLPGAPGEVIEPGDLTLYFFNGLI